VKSTTEPGETTWDDVDLRRFDAGRRDVLYSRARKIWKEMQNLESIFRIPFGGLPDLANCNSQIENRAQ